MSVPKFATSRSTVAGMKVPHAAPRWVFFAVFAISGFSGLIYESIWSHYLKLFLGHAAYAQSLVLIIFMGGMALGSWLAARFSERWRNRSSYYAIVEGIIGVIAIVFHRPFVGDSDAFYFVILPAIGNPLVGGALKWTAAASLIVPQSVLLGMTFPLAHHGDTASIPDSPGGSLAMLYFTNSIGAAIGVLASGFWLIGLVGLPGTILTAGLLNIALALVVWVLVKLDPAERPAARATGRAPLAAGTQPRNTVFLRGRRHRRRVIHLRDRLDTDAEPRARQHHALVRADAERFHHGPRLRRAVDEAAHRPDSKDPLRFAGWVQVLMGVLAILTVPLYVQTFDWMAALLAGLQKTDAGYTLFTAFSHAIALLVMVPDDVPRRHDAAAVHARVTARSISGEGAIGRVYAATR